MTPNCGPVKTHGAGLGAHDGVVGWLGVSLRTPEMLGNVGNCGTVCRVLLLGTVREELNWELKTDSSGELFCERSGVSAGVVAPDGADDGLNSDESGCCAGGWNNDELKTESSAFLS